MNNNDNNYPKRKRQLGAADLDVDMFNTNTVISSTECTGLTPKNVEDEDEALSYTEIYNIHLHHNDKSKDNKEKK